MVEGGRRRKNKSSRVHGTPQEVAEVMFGIIIEHGVDFNKICPTSLSPSTPPGTNQDHRKPLKHAKQQRHQIHSKKESHS